jgi:hypothetical protein
MSNVVLWVMPGRTWNGGVEGVWRAGRSRISTEDMVGAARGKCDQDPLMKRTWLGSFSLCMIYAGRLQR